MYNSKPKYKGTFCTPETQAATTRKFHPEIKNCQTKIFCRDGYPVFASRHSEYYPKLGPRAHHSHGYSEAHGVPYGKSIPLKPRLAMHKHKEVNDFSLNPLRFG